MDVGLNHRRVPQETEETRERILSAAQKLFSEIGFEGTSVRDITTEAGCNVASVNYHFGGKDNLYLETFRSMLVVLRDQRLAVIGELMARDPAPTLEEFLESFAEGFIDPLVDESRGRMFTILVSREMFNPRLPHNVFVDEFIQPLLERATAYRGPCGGRTAPRSSCSSVVHHVGGRPAPARDQGSPPLCLP